MSKRLAGGWLFFSLITLNTASFVATNLYVPAMPAMSLDLGVSEASIQSTLTLYMIPFALVPLFLGPLADKSDRRTFILYTLLLALLSNLLIITGWGLWIGRFMQGAAFGLLTISARALVADLFSGKDQAKYQSLIQCFSPILSMGSPVLGGMIHYCFNWRGIFVFFTIYTCLLWVLTYLTAPNQRPKKTAKYPSFKDYGTLLRNPSFMRYACLPAIFMIGQSGYVTLSSFIFQNVYHLNSAQYGLSSGPVYGALIGGAALNIYLLKRFDMHFLMKLGTGVMFASATYIGLYLLLGQLTMGHLIIGCMLFFAANSLLVTNAYALACKHVHGSQGCAFALMSLIKMTAGILTTELSSLLSFRPVSLFALFLIAACIAFLLTSVRYSLLSPIKRELLEQA